MNVNWPRWIFASVAKHFSDKCLLFTPPLPLLIEGTPKRNNEFEDWAELRIDGPYFSGRSKDEWGARVEVNVVLSSALNESNNYRIYTNQGLICGAFQTTIPILKLGDGPDDDQSFVTCLMLDTMGKERLIVSNFGQISPAVQLLQCTIEGHYHANLNG